MYIRKAKSSKISDNQKLEIRANAHTDIIKKHVWKHQQLNTRAHQKKLILFIYFVADDHTIKYWYDHLIDIYGETPTT